MEPSVGYNEARRLLECRYGNAISAATAYVEKIRRWPHIGGDDIEALDEFSIFLNACKNAMLGLPMLAHEMEHPHVMREVLEKLTYSLQDRWRRVADSITRQQGRPIVFADVANFVADEARIAANPLFGRQLFSAPSKRDGVHYQDSVPSQSNRGREKTQRLNINSQVFHVGSVRTEHANSCSCLYCGGGHQVEMCQSLEKATSDERWRFVLAKRLCFGCLGDDHQIKDCRNNEEKRRWEYWHRSKLQKQEDKNIGEWAAAPPRT